MTSTGRSSGSTSCTRSRSTRRATPRWPRAPTRTVKTALSIPVFWAADKLSRKWFNEIFYRSYEGASEDRLVVLAEELFEDVIKPNIYPRARDLIDESRRAGVPPGAGLRRARLHDAAARALPRGRRPDREPARVRRPLRDRQAQEAVRRRRDEGRHHARLRPPTTTSTSPSRGRTPTASPTTRCSPWSATRPRATPTSGCARSRAATTGRCSTSTSDPARSAARRPQGLARPASNPQVPET